MCKKLQCFLLIIFFYFFSLLISSLFWILDVAGSVALLPISAFASSAALAGYNKIKFNSKIVAGFTRNLLFLAVITGVAVIISILIFDSSHDGQSYHYETQAAILNGWNPVRHELSAGTVNIFFINHYAKGYEMVAAYFWALFKNPESGKAMNILLLAACFFYTSYLLQELKIFSKRFWLIFVSLLIACNPITVYQLFTFNVDGQIASLITLLIGSLYLSMKKRSSLHLVIAVIVFCVMSNLKFTGLIYSIIIFGFFGLWMLVKKINILRFILAGIVAVMVAVLLIGFNPYVTNTIHQSNPFYPLVGKNKIDIITAVQPASFAHKNPLQKFAESNFSVSHNIHGHAVTPEPKFKIPFTFTVNEWLVFKGAECRIAGYGPLFGGIFLISFILLVMAVLIKKRKIIQEDAFIISILLLLTVVINPEMWMSRYVPQLWLFPFCILWLSRKEIYSVFYNLTSRVLLVALAVNVAGIAIVNWGVAGLISFKMHKELAWIKTLDQPVQIVTNDFIAAKERILLYKIPLHEVRRDTASVLQRDGYKLQNSQAIILLPPGVAKFENTGILKLLDKKLE